VHGDDIEGNMDNTMASDRLLTGIPSIDTAYGGLRRDSLWLHAAPLTDMSVFALNLAYDIILQHTSVLYCPIYPNYSHNITHSKLSTIHSTHPKWKQDASSKDELQEQIRALDFYYNIKHGQFAALSQRSLASVREYVAEASKYLDVGFIILDCQEVQVTKKEMDEAKQISLQHCASVLMLTRSARSEQRPAFSSADFVTSSTYKDGELSISNWKNRAGDRFDSVQVKVDPDTLRIQL
jgi:hypothetical protein